VKLGYFPGCSLHSTAKEFDLLLKAVAGPLGVVSTWLFDESAKYRCPKPTVVRPLSLGREKA
jgi:heterodisulfide reductase subunit B